MEYNAGVPLPRVGPPVATDPTFSSCQDFMWQANLRSSNAVGLAPPYPERIGEPDCSYYIRTGSCRFGVTCRFNHPPNRSLATAAARMKGEYPERLGQPECQYYLKTGICKFGATCKFHHPREIADAADRVSLNILGFPLRPDEIECAYYLRTGHCKFGSMCRYHHPQPTNVAVSQRCSPVYPTMQSPTTAQPPYPGDHTNWSRASFIASPRWQSPSSYPPLMLPQGVVSVPSWNAHSGHLGSVASSENHQRGGNAQLYGTYRQSESFTTGLRGAFPSYRTGSVPAGFISFHSDSVFPGRPGQPECQFYMKTGDCKFGAVCKFHHPRERFLPAPDCLLSPIGLPLRPGEPACMFYSRYGICKFGHSCKFDHPVGIFYDYAASSSADASVRQLTLSSEVLVDTSLKSRGVSLSEPTQLSSGDEQDDTIR